MLLTIPDPHSFKSPTGRALARETFGARQNLAMKAACGSEYKISINSLDWNPFVSFHISETTLKCVLSHRIESENTEWSLH